MKIYSIIIFFCTYLFFLNSCKERANNTCNYFELTTSNFSTSSNFIALDIKGADSTFTVVIQNNDFYEMLLRNIIVKSEEAYTAEILGLLKDGKPFLASSQIERPLKDYAVVKDTILKSLLSLNKDSLLSRYFDNNFLKRKEIDYPQEKRIIYALCKAGIPCWRDDVSGSILIKDTVYNINCK